MADSHTTRNVESPLVWSVVDPSTTGVDASKSTSTSDAPGDSPSNTTASPNTNPTTSTTTDSSNPEIRKNDGQTETGGVVDEMGGNLDSKDGARSGEVGSDVDRSGSASPTKSDRKLATKKLSFKPVSLNRAFLGDAPATTAAPASMSSALQSKGTGLSTGLSLAAPRPIATSKLKLTRSGSSSQTSRPTLGSGGIGSGGGNSQPVWNKNQPTPPPPKKEFTDEELSKKYGIHLASRLGSDDTTNKEAKWADIDDDDDDWVPTTIEWNDGMKATIPDAPPAVPTPEPVGEPAKEPVKPPAKEPAKEPIKDAIRELVKNALQPQSSSGKPSAPAPTKELLTLSSSGHKTLVTQKPGTKTLQTTPVPPTVRQSPWAKLPPINPAPPVQVSPTLNSRRPLDNASHRVEREPPVVREVSAEVYDRSWRDRNGAQGNRELFNSQTGKMEPVPDDRRPAHSPVPKPAVLQRPAGPPQQSGGPAEPSAAFQTGRSSHRPDDFRRRRTSSNVSGGSGSVGRRLSFTRFAGGDPPTPDDMGFARDRPMYSNPFDEHGPPQRQYGGYGSHHIQPPFHQGHKEISPTITNASPVPRLVVPHSPVPVPPQEEPEAQPQVQPETQPQPPQIPEESAEDLLAKQERVMREAREMARKRKKEEEEREEAAKKERLRVKLEALERLDNEKEAARKAEEERERIAKQKQEAEEAERRLAEEREKALVRERESAKATAEAEAQLQSRQHQTASSRNDPSHSIVPSERSNFAERYVRRPSFARSAAHTSTSSPSSLLSQPQPTQPSSTNPTSYLSSSTTTTSYLPSSTTSTSYLPSSTTTSSYLPSSTNTTSHLHTSTYRPPHLSPHSPTLSNMSPSSLNENPVGKRNNSIGSNNSGNNFPGSNSGYPNNNRNPTWKSGATNPRGNNNTQWGSSQSSSPWGAVGDGSRPGVNSANNNMSGNVMNNSNNNRPVFDGPRPGHDGSRYNNINNGNNNNGLRYNNNRANGGNGGNGYNNHNGGGGYNRNGGNGYGNRHRGDRHSDRRTPSPTSGPLGAISRDDRDQAVNRWNMLPSQIDADAAAAREINHAARLAREAEEAATGIKKQTPTINYDIVEEFNEYQLDETGPKVDRALIAKTVKERKDIEDSKTAIEASQVGARVTQVDRALIPKTVREHNDIEVSKRAIEASKVGAGISPSEEVNNKLAAILMAHNHHHRQHDEAGSETHKIGKLPENTIAIPKGPAGTKPSRFFPTQANKTIAEHIAEHMKQNEEIAKPADAKLGQAGYRKNDNPVQRSFSPPPPMSADHPVHGATKIARVQLPGGAGMHTGGEEPGHSGTMKRFEEVQRRILAGVPGHAAPAVLGPPGLFKEGRDRMTVASKPSFDDTPEKQLKVPTVSLPCKVEESAGDVSMVTVLDSEEFITEFFQQDFGSTPNVRIPRPAHGFDVPAATNGRNTVKRAAVKDGVQSVPLYHPFGFKDFTNGQGEKFIPIQFPGGIRKEVAYNGQLFFPGSGSGGSGDKRGGRGFPKKRGGGRGGYAGGFGRKKAPEA